MTGEQQKYEDWIEYYYKKIKKYLPFLMKEFNKHNLTKEQTVAILEGVFRRAINDFY